MIRSLGLTFVDLEMELKRIKHLSGQHDQATHGNRFGRVGKNPRALVHIGGGPPGRNVHHYDENDEAATLGPHPAASEGGQEHAIVEAKYTDPEELPSAKKYMDGENFESEEPGDKVLEAIYKDQGYDGKPHLVEDHELDAFVASGEPELFRGVGDVRFAKDYQDGPYFGGEGLFGNGTYTGKVRKGRKWPKFIPGTMVVS